jgi:glycosyltransferase involved in cell wall biosynthesis
MKKAILFLDQQGWLGGAQRVLEATLDSLEESYEVIAAFPEQGPFRSALEQRNIETLDFPIGVYRAGQKSVVEMAAFAVRSVYCGFKLAVLLRRRRFALVYINGPRCLPAGVLAAWLTRTPSIFHLHLILQRRLEVALVAWLSRHVSRIFACSHAAAASLLHQDCRLGAKTQVVYNPLRRCPGEARYKTDRWTIGMVGRITETKGHHLLLHAVGRLPPELRCKVQVLIVGSSAPRCPSDVQYAERLRLEAVRLGIHDQILWAGYQAEMGAYYASMDVLVHPALAEAMCIVILEALDRGIPIIAARTGGIPEVVQDGLNGLLIPVADENALAAALELFFENSDVRERLRTGAGRRLDDRFSIETFSSKIRAAIPAGLEGW